MSVLSLTNVTKHYHRTPAAALSGLTLDVQEGEILSVTGESGSGKTTLLRLIAGLEVPETGTISISGRAVCGPGLTPVVPEQRGVGMVFQNYALFPYLTIRDNVLYGLIGSRPSKEREAILFGRMNFLPSGALGRPHTLGPLWIRPEHLELLPALSENAIGLTGTVVRTHFYGDRQEVVISCNGPNGSTHELALLGDPLIAFKQGSRVYLREKQPTPVHEQAS